MFCFKPSGNIIDLNVKGKKNYPIIRVRSDIMKDSHNLVTVKQEVEDMEEAPVLERVDVLEVHENDNFETPVLKPIEDILGHGSGVQNEDITSQTVQDVEMSEETNQEFDTTMNSK